MLTRSWRWCDAYLGWHVRVSSLCLALLVEPAKRCLCRVSGVFTITEAHDLVWCVCAHHVYVYVYALARVCIHEGREPRTRLVAPVGPSVWQPRPALYPVLGTELRSSGWRMGAAPTAPEACATCSHDGDPASVHSHVTAQVQTEALCAVDGTGRLRAPHPLTSWLLC